MCCYDLDFVTLCPPKGYFWKFGLHCGDVDVLEPYEVEPSTR
jgi:hypothetical protein